MRHRTAAIAIGAAGVAGAAATAVTGWSLVQNPRLPLIDQDSLWTDDPTRTALVLGIGGVVGAAWEACILGQLAAQGWDARDSGLVIGTSAGSLAAVTVRSGLPPEAWPEFGAHGRVILNGHTVQLPDPRAGEREHGKRPQLPWAQSVHALTGHRLPHLTAALVGMIPVHGFSLAALAKAVDDLWKAGHPVECWPERATWIPAVDLYNGQRVVFGADGEPRPRLGAAVAASCAVPGMFAPVRVGDRHYVDGGVVSFTSIDLALHAGARRIVALNPLSLAPRADLSGFTAAGHHVARRALGAGFHKAVARARGAGTDVHVIVPTQAELQAMGPHPLDFDRGERIADAVSARKHLPGPLAV